MKLLKPSDNIVANPRSVWQESFSKVAESNDRIIAMTGDLSRSICTDTFRKRVPERFFNMGIAEQNMLGTAAGLALCGMIPYCVTYAPFVALRAVEQFRTDACYMGLNVRVISAYGGIVEAGCTHAGLEDAGVIRGIPNTTIISPSDVNMVPKVFAASVDHPGPVYIRLGVGKNEPNIYGEDYDFVVGKAIRAREGRDATIISTGIALRFAVEAASILEQEGVDVEIIDMHTLKPLDADAVIASARKTGRVVTVEDHSVYNGLGSAVAETLLEAGVPCRFKRLGIPDVFPVIGKPDKLYVKYGYGTDATVQAVRSML